MFLYSVRHTHWHTHWPAANYGSTARNAEKGSKTFDQSPMLPCNECCTLKLQAAMTRAAVARRTKAPPASSLRSFGPLAASLRMDGPRRSRTISLSPANSMAADCELIIHADRQKVNSLYCTSKQERGSKCGVPYLRHVKSKELQVRVCAQLLQN